MTRFWLILAAFLGLAATVVPASADIVYTLSNGGSILPTPGSYGTVTVSQTASQLSAGIIQVKIDLLSTERLLTTGGHDGIVFSLTGSPDLTSITVVSANASGFTVKPLGGSYSDSPFLGPFEYAIAWNGNGAGSATETSITFDLNFGSSLALSPTLFALTSGTYFAVDIGRGCSTTTNPNNGKTSTSCAATGPIATGDPVVVPEPSTVAMSIAGLMGLAGFAMIQRRRKLVRAV